MSLIIYLLAGAIGGVFIVPAAINAASTVINIGVLIGIAAYFAGGYRIYLRPQLEEAKMNKLLQESEDALTKQIASAARQKQLKERDF